MWFTKKGRAKAQVRKWFIEAQAAQELANQAWQRAVAEEFRVQQDARWNQVGR